MRKKATLLAILGGGLFLGYMIYASLSVTQVTCDVCIEFQGRRECRTAGGANAEEAQRTATDVACAFLASGRTENILCGNTPPVSVMCMER